MFSSAKTIGGCLGRLSRLPLSHVKVLTNVQYLYTSEVGNVRSKDISVTVPSPPPGSQDILLQNIKSAKNSLDVLNSVNRHYTIMNSTHAVQALKSLFTLQKAQSSQVSNGEVVSSKDFRYLCNVLKSQIRHLELNDLIDVVKCLGYLGVAADSKLMSIVLGLISKQVNDLSLQQITFLDFVMADFKQTPLVKALKIALPIVFEANLQSRCNLDNIPQMTDLLFFVCKRKHMVRSYDVLVDALIKKRHQFSLKDAKTIVLGLSDTRYFNENNHLLLHHSLDILTDSIHKTDFYEVESMLYKLNKKHVESNGNPSYYHEEFCDACARNVIEKNYGFEQAIWILKKLSKFNHTHLPLLLHLAEKVEKEPWLLEQCGANGLISFLTGLSLADFKPPNWDRLKPLVIKACQGLMDRSELPWLKVVLDLCIMDVWSEEFFKKVFSREFLDSFMSRDYNKLDRIQLLQLDQVSATLSPWAIKPRAPPDIITPIIQFMGTHMTSFNLHLPLQHGLGGPEYVHTSVTSPLGHFLDHVVVMRKGGYPVAINLDAEESQERRVRTEDILVPPDSKMIAVLFVPSSMCATNNERVRGLFRIQVNTIEALGIAVCPILQPVWNTLPDFERIPFLMRAVRDKLPSYETTDVITPYALWETLYIAFSKSCPPEVTVPGSWRYVRTICHHLMCEHVSTGYLNIKPIFPKEYTIATGFKI